MRRKTSPEEHDKNITDDTILSSHQIARLLQSSPSAVLSWFDQGMLDGFRTPGGHRRVKVRELRQFLQKHHIPIPRALGGNADIPFRVMIIDDEDIVLRTMQRDLAKTGCHLDVHVSTKPVEALVEIGAHPPHLIFLDIYMKEMNGFEVCRQLKGIEKLKDIIIVAMSAHPTLEDQEHISQCGAQYYLSKPISLPQLIELIPDRYRNKTPNETQAS